jgi:hypothetical protein
MKTYPSPLIHGYIRMTGVSPHRYLPHNRQYTSVGSDNEGAREQDTDILPGVAHRGYRDCHHRDSEDGAKPRESIEEQRQRSPDPDTPTTSTNIVAVRSSLVRS